jgi:oxygen-independent coproporphyrinogen-3 oxidase
LYIHVPFCAGACDYCDFYSIPLIAAGTGRMDVFIDTLLADIADQLAFFSVERVPTVYIGGGTPSILGAKRAGRLFEGLRALLPGEPQEFTVEVNPESADEELLGVCRDGGVTRMSLGLQTFHEPSRRAVHRLGQGTLLDERLALLSRYYPAAFSADLIAGLPFQSGEVLRSDIKRLLAFEPAHVSLYSLTIEPGTPLATEDRFQTILPSAGEADAIWLAGRDALEEAGYAQYEVSNFARDGGHCAHNIRYWRMENWLGAGPAASGTIIDDAGGTGSRRTYPADIDAYLGAARPAITSSALVEELDRETLIRESFLMGFRYCGGPDPALFCRRFSQGIAACIPQTIARWQERGFFAVPGGLAPSRQGLLFLDAFLRDTFGERDTQITQTIHTVV